MEGFGVINLEKLNQYKQAFDFFSQHLSYPEELSIFNEEFFEATFASGMPGLSSIRSYWDKIGKFDELDKIQEQYIETFDFQKKATLYMTYAKFEDSKERGQMLARLKVLYEMYGLNMDQAELSDYLPLMCEFIFAADWLEDERSLESFSLLFAVIEDGTYHLLQTLEKQNSPYFYLIQGMRELMKSCVLKQEVESK